MVIYEVTGSKYGPSTESFTVYPDGTITGISSVSTSTFSPSDTLTAKPVSVS